MANTIDWGQASVNNTIDYGDGAIDNTINWGKIYASSASGDTNIGTAATPSFSNTKSILLDGVDDFVNVADNSNLSFGNGSTDSPFSISTWVNMTDASTFRILSKYASSAQEYFLVTDSTDKINFSLYDNSTGGRLSRKYNTPLTSFEGQWIHLVATYDGTTNLSGLKIYLNGLRVDNANNQAGSYTAMENTTQPLEIGKVTTTNANGLIDETAIFNSELSQSDITAIYGSGVPTSLSSYSSLISWWRCGDGDSAPILTDNGSGGNNGTMTNFTTFSTDVPT